RLAGGLVIALDKPDRTTRMAILKSRASDFARSRGGQPVPEDVLERIADMEENSPRDLIGVFTKLATYADLTKQPLTLEAAQQILGQTTVSARKTSIEDIQRRRRSSTNSNCAISSRRSVRAAWPVPVRWQCSSP